MYLIGITYIFSDHQFIGELDHLFPLDYHAIDFAKVTNELLQVNLI